MKTKLLSYGILLSLAILYPWQLLIAEPAEGEAYKNYTGILTVYSRWNKGILQSKKQYKKNMTRYLETIKGKEMQSDYEYFLLSPETRYGQDYSYRLYSDKNIQIIGDISEQVLSKYIDKTSPITKWKRIKILLSISGTVTKFKLVSNQSSETIIIFLKDIKFREAGINDAGKNSNQQKTNP